MLEGTAEAPKKKRKFVESVELQIGLRDYDPERDKRFSGSIKLPFTPHPGLKVFEKFLNVYFPNLDCHHWYCCSL